MLPTYWIEVSLERVSNKLNSILATPTITTPVTGYSSYARAREGQYLNGQSSLLTYVEQVDPIWVNATVDAVGKIQATVKLSASADASVRRYGAIQPCSWNRVFSALPTSLAIAVALPLIVLLPLSSPYAFIPVLTMSPAGL
jgi:hypothetical protein